VLKKAGADKVFAVTVARAFQGSIPQHPQTEAPDKSDAYEEDATEALAASV